MAASNRYFVDFIAVGAVHGPVALRAGSGFVGELVVGESVANLAWLVLGPLVTVSVWVAPTFEAGAAVVNGSHAGLYVSGARALDFSMLDACDQLAEEDQRALGIDGGVHAGPGGSSCQYERVARTSTTTVSLLSGPLYVRQRVDMTRTGRDVNEPLDGYSADGVQHYDQEAGRDTCMVLVNFPGGNGALVVDENLGDPSISMVGLCGHVASVARTVIRSVR